MALIASVGSQVFDLPTSPQDLLNIVLVFVVVALVIGGGFYLTRPRK